MSLLDEMSDEYTILDKTTVSDGLGGYKTTWKDGATITASISVASESEVVVAEKAGEHVTHNLFISNNLTLDYHTVLKRRKDNKILRTTSKGDEAYTPPSSTLNLRKIQCEEWEIPAND